MEVSGPPSGRKGTRNRGPEWTPILTPPSQEDLAKKKKIAAGAERALVGKGAKGLLSLVAEEVEADVGASREEEEGGRENGEHADLFLFDASCPQLVMPTLAFLLLTDMTIATEVSFLAPSPFFRPSRASSRKEEDRGEGPSRSRRSAADFSLQGASPFLSDVIPSCLISPSTSFADATADDLTSFSTRPGYENVLTQQDASDVTRSRFEDPDETGSSLDESQVPVKRKGKARGSVSGTQADFSNPNLLDF